VKEGDVLGPAFTFGSGFSIRIASLRVLDQDGNDV
jgi:hypothetical protein